MRHAGYMSVTQLPEFADLVLELVEEIPPGLACSYGDIAQYVGRGGPRQVGAVLAEYGAAVAWWRVVRADGSLPQVLAQRARPFYLNEGTALCSNGTRVDLAVARWSGLR
jgi:alkylated DNA nucleotide flippase Atl1